MPAGDNEAEVLIVEDEALIGMVLEDALVSAGYRLRGLASTEVDADQLMDGIPPTFAVVDINLGHGGSGLNVGRRLAVRGTIVVYASGNCPELRTEMAATGALGCLGKPYDPTQVAAALAAIAALLHGDTPPVLPTALHVFAA